MKNHRYSTAGKIATVIMQQFMAVLLVVFLLLLEVCSVRACWNFRISEKADF